MAMVMQGAVELPAAKALVWKALNDPEVMRSCIPGCHALDRTGETSFKATARFKIGLLTATLKGDIVLTNVDPLNGYHIAGEGRGGLAGFAKGGADIHLADTPGGTLLRYDVEAQVSGRLAQIGSFLVSGVAQRTADRFFANFAAALQTLAERAGHDGRI